MPVVNRADVRAFQLSTPAAGLDLSNDGRSLAMAHEGPGATVTIVDTASGSVRGETGHDAQRAWAVAFTEGGKALHFVEWNDSNTPTLCRFDPSSGRSEVVKVYSSSDCIRHLARDQCLHA